MQYTDEVPEALEGTASKGKREEGNGTVVQRPDAQCATAGLLRTG